MCVWFCVCSFINSFIFFHLIFFFHSLLLFTSNYNNFWYFWYLCKIYNVNWYKCRFNVNKASLPYRPDPVSHLLLLGNGFKMDPPFGVNACYGLFPAPCAKGFHLEHLLCSHCPFLLILPPPTNRHTRRFLGHRVYMCII